MVSEYVVYDSSMCESHCLMRMSVAPLSDVNVTVGEYTEKTRCSEVWCCAIVVGCTLGGSAGDWWVCGLGVSLVAADCSQRV